MLGIGDGGFGWGTRFVCSEKIVQSVKADLFAERHFHRYNSEILYLYIDDILQSVDLPSVKVKDNYLLLWL